MKRNTVARAIEEQVQANRSAIGHETSFAGHRARLTQEIVAQSPPDGRGRLCLLGAGNAFDVDLPLLATKFEEIHLVDIDAAAVRATQARCPPQVRHALRLHAPVDVSGSWDRLAEWARRPAPARSLPPEVGPAVARVLGAVPTGFDVVASCCMLTQLQLVLVEELGDRHPAFETLRSMLNAIHVRVLTGLLGPSGRALLVNDLTSDATYPLEALAPDADLENLMADLLSVGNVIHAAHPGFLSAEVRRDPVLSAAFSVRFPIGPWLWHAGPERIFLVYALEIARKPDTAATSSR